MRAVLVVGLPGSGKTHTAVNEFVPQGCVLVDDPRTFADFEAAVALRKDLVLTDPHLCFAHNRRVAEVKFREAGFQVEWVFFENSPTKAKANVERREMVEQRPCRTGVDMFSWNYVIPAGVPIRPIWTPDSDMLPSSGGFIGT